MALAPQVSPEPMQEPMTLSEDRVSCGDEVPARRHELSRPIWDAPLWAEIRSHQLRAYFSCTSLTR